MDYKAKAQGLLRHYIQVAHGDRLDADCIAEIGDIVDFIIEASVQAALEAHDKRERDWQDNAEGGLAAEYRHRYGDRTKGGGS